MRGLQSQFDTALLAAIALTVIAIVTAAVTAGRHRASGDPWWPPATRVLAVGSAIVTVVATAFPRSARLETDGDLVLRPGRGGLGNLDQLLDDPNSLAAVLFVANVVLYVPIAFFATVGWPHRRRLVLPACLALALGVEAVQFLALGRVAATDDLILNTLGALLGHLAALATPSPVGLGQARRG